MRSTPPSRNARLAPPVPTSLVTGGAGFIGSHLTEHLLARGHRVIVLDDLSAGDRGNLPEGAPGLEFVHGSVTDAALLAALVPRTDRVFHLAGVVGVKLLATAPVQVIETNVLGTIEVLRACARHRRPVLTTSSSEVYGKALGGSYAEDDDVTLGAPTKARWSYACSKMLGEHLLLAHFRETALPAVVVRLFNVSGPRQKGRYGMVVPRFVEQALSEQPITVYGDGTQHRCFCHVHDVVGAIGRLLETPAAYGKVVNLGGRESVTIRELAELVRELTGSGSGIVHVPFEQAYGAGLEDMHRRAPDLGSAHALVGYVPEHSLREIVASVVEHQRRHRTRPASSEPTTTAAGAAKRALSS